MARLYELWDGETGNLIGAYASEQEALAAVHDTVRRYGLAAATNLALAIEDVRGEGGLMASGGDLVERARLSVVTAGSVDGVSTVDEDRQRVGVGEARPAGGGTERGEHRGLPGGSGLAIVSRDCGLVGGAKRDASGEGREGDTAGSAGGDEPVGGAGSDRRRERPY